MISACLRAQSKERKFCSGANLGSFFKSCFRDLAEFHVSTEKVLQNYGGGRVVAISPHPESTSPGSSMPVGPAQSSFGALRGSGSCAAALATGSQSSILRAVFRLQQFLVHTEICTPEMCHQFDGGFQCRAAFTGCCSEASHSSPKKRVNRHRSNPCNAPSCKGS